MRCEGNFTRKKGAQIGRKGFATPRESWLKFCRIVAKKNGVPASAASHRVSQKVIETLIETRKIARSSFVCVDFRSLDVDVSSFAMKRSVCSRRFIAATFPGVHIIRLKWSHPHRTGTGTLLLIVSSGTELVEVVFGGRSFVIHDA